MCSQNIYGQKVMTKSDHKKCDHNKKHSKIHKNHQKIVIFIKKYVKNSYILSKITKILTRLQYKCSKHVQKRSKAFKNCSIKVK